MALLSSMNVSSMTYQRNLRSFTSGLQCTTEKIASGYKINRSSDDVAGLNISETLNSPIRGLKKAVDNAQDGINILQTGEGALSVIAENLQRIRELTVKAANDTNSVLERKSISEEVKARIDDINNIANTTKSSNVNILDGSRSNYYLQVGSNGDITKDTIDIGQAFTNSRSSAIGITMAISATGLGAYASNSSSRSFLNEIDSAISKISSQRSNLGSFQKRLSGTIESLRTQVQNLQETNSRIKDTDMSSEHANFIQKQILQQSALSITSQANQSVGYALKLLA